MEIMAENIVLNLRLVHLDLKGAHPSLSYLEKFLPLVKQWGGTGLLVEYEDVFPYDKHLKTLACPEAYSKEEVLHLLQLAKSNDLKVIPLVQTFGHMEFVLKHSQFSHLREVENLCMALCPSNQESISLVESMLDQIMELHSDVDYFHIGCDEVYHLGLCEECVNSMTTNNWDKGQLFFSHVKRIATYLRGKYPHITCIIWDDMLRYLDPLVIQGCELRGLVEPMVWHYLPVFALPNDLWSKLSTAFPHVWIASAFKGATGPRAVIPNIKYHLDNHYSWLQLLPHIASKFKSIKGIAFTGWQRYDHYAVFCEFLPTAIPSLALCMKFTEVVNFKDAHIKHVCKELGFEFMIPLSPLQPINEKGDFPGKDLFFLMNTFSIWEVTWKELMMSDYLEAWVNEFNVARKFINPVHAQPVLSQAMHLLNSCTDMENKMLSCCQQVFHSPDSVSREWLGQFLLPKKKQLERFVSEIREVIDE